LKVAALADFNGDGRGDMLFRNNNGTFTSGNPPALVSNPTSTSQWGSDLGSPWSPPPTSTAMLRPDVPQQQRLFTEWQSTGNGFTPNVYVNGRVDNTRHLAQIGDPSGDGKDDLLWRIDSGTFTEWRLQAMGSGPTSWSATPAPIDHHHSSLRFSL
jgi:hypothetical protein